MTGARGFIGSWVIRRLVREGAGVVGADITTTDHRLRQILDQGQAQQVEFVRLDVTDPDAVTGLLERFQFNRIIHLAGLQTLACRTDPVLGAMVNVAGTVAMFQAAKRTGFDGHLVYASSTATYELGDGYTIAGEQPRGTPGTLYGVYKLANERSATVFWEEDQVPSIGLRPFVVYGVGRYEGLTAGLTDAMRAAALGDEYQIPFGGRTQLHYVDDVAAAFIAANVPL